MNNVCWNLENNASAYSVLADKRHALLCLLYCASYLLQAWGQCYGIKEIMGTLSILAVFSSLYPLPPRSLKVFELMIVLARHLLRVRSPFFLGLTVLIEVARIGRVFQFGYDGTFDFAVVEGIPVDGGEEGMRFDAVDAASKVSKALGRIDGAKTRDKRAGVRVEVGREFDLAYADPIARTTSAVSMANRFGPGLLFIDLHRVVVPKRWCAYKEFIHQDPKCPPVHGSSVPWFEGTVKDCLPRGRVGFEQR